MTDVLTRLAALTAKDERGILPRRFHLQKAREVPRRQPSLTLAFAHRFLRRGFDVIAHFDTSRHTLFERIGLLCFAIAVIMEICAYPYGKRNDELSATQIASANERAAGANERAAHLEASNKQLSMKLGNVQIALEEERQKTARFQRQADAASLALEQQLQEQKVEASRLAKLAEDEKSATGRIEDRLDRTIRGGMPGAISAMNQLKKFAGQDINLISFPDDPEIAELASSLGGILRSAGWKVFSPVGGIYRRPTPFNVSLEVQDPYADNVGRRALEAADALIQILQANRILVGGPTGMRRGETEAGELQLNPVARVTIVIGKRR